MDLRAPLIGDLLARTAELRGLQALTVLITPGLLHEPGQALDRAMAALGIHPPATVGAHQLTETLCAAADVHLLAYGAATQDGGGGVRVDVGQVSPAAPDGDIPDGAPLLASGLLDEFSPAGTDPLAVRMLLLGHAHRTPVTVTGAGLTEARRTLRRRRQQVADWAQEPPRPIPADVLRQAQAALADNLGVPVVLDMLRQCGRARRCAGRCQIRDVRLSRPDPRAGPRARGGTPAPGDAMTPGNTWRLVVLRHTTKSTRPLLADHERPLAPRGRLACRSWC
ncbi:hypothetical protein ACWCYZ_21450 [Streptomyces virginiae]